MSDDQTDEIVQITEQLAQTWVGMVDGLVRKFPDHRGAILDTVERTFVEALHQRTGHDPR